MLGTAAIDATGNALDNTLTGNAGNNRLDGGAGADTLIGGAGDDTYVVDQANDRIVELAGQGNDTVVSSVDWALGAHLENGRLSGSAHLSLTGNALDNLLSGNSGNNFLDGGAGHDTMIGGAGDDTYRVDQVGDRVVEWSGGGNDTVLSDISYVLPEHARALDRRLALLELQQRRIEAELNGDVLRTVAADPTDLLADVLAQWQARRQAHADAVNQERAQMERIGHERQAALAQLQRLQTALPSLERGARAHDRHLPHLIRREGAAARLTPARPAARPPYPTS